MGGARELGNPGGKASLDRQPEAEGAILGPFGHLKEDGMLGGSKEGTSQAHTALSPPVRILDPLPRAIGSR